MQSPKKVAPQYHTSSLDGEVKQAHYVDRRLSRDSHVPEVLNIKYEIASLYISRDSVFGEQIY